MGRTKSGKFKMSGKYGGLKSKRKYATPAQRKKLAKLRFKVLEQRVSAANLAAFRYGQTHPFKSTKSFKKEFKL